MSTAASEPTVHFHNIHCRSLYPPNMWQTSLCPRQLNPNQPSTHLHSFVGSVHQTPTTSVCPPNAHHHSLCPPNTYSQCLSTKHPPSFCPPNTHHHSLSTKHPPVQLFRQTPTIAVCPPNTHHHSLCPPNIHHQFLSIKHPPPQSLSTKHPPPLSLSSKHPPPLSLSTKHPPPLSLSTTTVSVHHTPVYVTVCLQQQHSTHLQFLHGFSPDFTHLEVQVFLDGGQGDVVLHTQTRQVREADLAEEGVDLGAHVLRHIHDGLAGTVGWQRHCPTLLLKASHQWFAHVCRHTHAQTHVGLCGVYDSSTLQTVAEDCSSFMWVLRLIKGPNSFALLDTAHLLNSSQHLKYETDRSEAKLPVMAPWGSLLAPISASSFLHMSHSRWAAVELSHPRQVSTWLMVLGFSHRSSRQPMIRLCMFFGHTWPK